MKNEIKMESVVKQNKDVQQAVIQLFMDLRIHYHNLRLFHWNVTGTDFYTLHAKFEEFYNDINLKVDETAERMLAIGVKPNYSLIETVSQSKIEEQTGLIEASDMVMAVIKGHEQLIRDLKTVLSTAEKANDNGTDDIFSPYIPHFEKENWMLKAYLKI